MKRRRAAALRRSDPVRHSEPIPFPYERDRGEFPCRSPEPHRLIRNSDEHPEAAYRRGVQQGAFFVFSALEAAGLLDTETERRVRKYVGWSLAHWRFIAKRRLEREFPRDRAPTLTLTRQGEDQ